MNQQTGSPGTSGAPQENEKGKSRPYGKLAKRGLKDRRFYRLYILGLLLFYCTVFYYAGEIIDFFKWEALRWNIFYAVHDVHRLLFLAPILYAAYAFGLKASIIITLVSGGVWMPRALFFSPYPSPLFRAILFFVVEGALGYLTATIFRQNRRLENLDAELDRDRDRLLEILTRMTDGVVVIGPDYKIRFANDAMQKIFGEGVGLPCYKYIYHFIEPCDNCKLHQVVQGKLDRWEYTLPDGLKYEVAASPFVDTDGVTCQLATYRTVNNHKLVSKS